VNNWTTLLRWIETEGFPPGILLGPNSRAWYEDEIEAWLANRPQAAGAA
jgi:predicted DNA-binding transcriptional regulator AlpA